MLKIEWTEMKDFTDRPTLVAHVRFGIKDTKGREMGVKLRIKLEGQIHDGEVEKVNEYYSHRKPRTAITSSIQACRDGKVFGGACPTEHEYATLEAAKADCEKRAMTSFKKTEKKAAANGGLYK